MRHDFRGNRGARNIDYWPWIWKEFKQQGYKTMFQSDFPAFDPFQFRLLGFQDPPTDIDGRTFYSMIQKLRLFEGVKFPEGLCIRGRPRHIAFLEFIHEFLHAYGDLPKFTYSDSLMPTHNDPTLV